MVRDYLLFLDSLRDQPLANSTKSKHAGVIRQVQMLAGHSSLAVTQRYIEGDGEARAKIVEVI